VNQNDINTIIYGSFKNAQTSQGFCNICQKDTAKELKQYIQTPPSILFIKLERIAKRTQLKVDITDYISLEDIVIKKLDEEPTYNKYKLYAIIADKKPKEQFYVTYIRISEKYY
jgi:hypothetical protein